MAVFRIEVRAIAAGDDPTGSGVLSELRQMGYSADAVREVLSSRVFLLQGDAGVLTAENLRTDLIELWGNRKLPIKGIILVTHNIEEAVLMCDRVLLFSSNPGRVGSEIKIDLPQPRAQIACRDAGRVAVRRDARLSRPEIRRERRESSAEVRREVLAALIDIGRCRAKAFLYALDLRLRGVISASE